MMKVLLPIDNSQCAQQTLAWATRFLNKDSARIYLVNVLFRTPEIPVTEYEKEESIGILNDAKLFFKQNGFIVEAAQMVIGNPIDDICAYADEKGVDQIIMGSHGRQGMAKFLMGSVSEGVFKKAKQPVIVVNNGPQSSISISHLEDVCLAEVE